MAFDNLTREQEDGLACVVCGQRHGAFVPVGFSGTGSQVFACLGSCYDQFRLG